MRGLSSHRAVAAPFFVPFSFVARFVQELFRNFFCLASNFGAAFWRFQNKCVNLERERSLMRSFGCVTYRK